MNNEEKFVIKTLKDSQNAYIENTKVKKVELSTDEAKVVLNLIEKQQKELEKKDKIIDKMADILIGLPLNEKLLSFGYKEEVKGYFTNLVEKENI